MTEVTTIGRARIASAAKAVKAAKRRTAAPLPSPASSGDHAPPGGLLDAIDLMPGVRIRADGSLEVIDVDVERGFADAVRRLSRFVRRRATAWSGGDRDLAADLAQEAWIKLWELDPLRFDPENWRDQSYVCAVLVSRIRDVARMELSRQRDMVHMHTRSA
jgi:hypothetical protein